MFRGTKTPVEGVVSLASVHESRSPVCKRNANTSGVAEIWKDAEGSAEVNSRLVDFRGGGRYAPARRYGASFPPCD